MLFFVAGAQMRIWFSLVLPLLRLTAATSADGASREYHRGLYSLDPIKRDRISAIYELFVYWDFDRIAVVTLRPLATAVI